MLSADRHCPRNAQPAVSRMSPRRGSAVVAESPSGKPGRQRRYRFSLHGISAPRQMRGGCAGRAEQAASVSAKSSQLSPNQTVALFEDGRVGSISSNHLGGDAAGDAQKESPGLATKARSRGRPSFYAATTSFSSPDDAGGEEQPVEQSPGADNVVPLRPKRAA